MLFRCYLRTFFRLRCCSWHMLLKNFRARFAARPLEEFVFLLSKSRIPIRWGKWDISLKILFHAHRVTYKFSADFTLLTSLPPALVSAPAWASTTRQRAKFRSIDQACPGSGGPRFDARSLTMPPLRPAYDPGTQASQSVPAQTRPAAPGCAPYRGRRSPHPQRSTCDTTSREFGRTPAPIARAAVLLQSIALSTASARQRSGPGRATNRDSLPATTRAPAIALEKSRPSRREQLLLSYVSSLRPNSH